MSVGILDRVSLGDTEAIKQFIETYGSLVWKLARRLTRCPADAEDATQDIFLDVWRSARRFDSTLGSEASFVATIARRRLTDRLRRAYSRPPMECLDGVELIDAERSASPESMVDVHHATLALRALRPNYRSVLELALLEGLTQAEIAVKLAIPTGTVKSYMRRGLMQMRDSRSTVAGSPTTGADRNRRKPNKRVEMSIGESRVKVIVLGLSSHVPGMCARTREGGRLV